MSTESPLASADDAAPGALAQLAQLLRAVRRRLLLVLAIVAAAVGATLALTLRQTEQYQATAKVYINQANPVNSLLSTGDTRPPDPERDFNSRVELITQPEVAARVIEDLDLDLSDTALLEKVETEVKGTSDIVNIHVQDPSPKLAADIANSFTREYVDARQEAARGTILQAAELAESQLASLSEVERAAPQGRELAQRLRELQINAALQTGGIEIVSAAAVPDAVASPHPMRMAILAGILAGILGVGLAVALELLDRRLKDESDLERFGPPLLSAVPPGGLETADFAVREALSTLATNLRFLKLQRDVTSLLITSPGPQEGKTSVTLGLSRALADLGLRVITIEADLRRPLFTEYTGLSPSNGLSTVLAGVVDIEDSLVDLDAETLRPLRADDPHGAPYFTVLPAGPVPPNPLGLLSSPAMADLVKRARAMADVVIIDTAPVGTVNDAVAVAELVDGIVLLSKLGQTRRDSLERTLRALSHLPTPVLGFVLTNAPRAEHSYYGYDRPYRPEAPALKS